jgi:hypothetical protein
MTTPPPTTHAASSSIRCSHGTETDKLTAAPQLTALPTLEPLALEVGGPLPSSDAEQQQSSPFVPPPPMPLQPPPRSPPRPLPQDPAGTVEDVEDVDAVMIQKQQQQQQEQQQQEQVPPTPIAAPARPLPSPAAAQPPPPARPAAASSAELPATPPSSSVPEAASWQSASRRRVAAARPGIFAPGAEQQMQHEAAAPPPAWLLEGWPLTAEELLLCARDAVATGVSGSPMLPGGGCGGDKKDEDEDREAAEDLAAFSFSAPFVGPLTAAQMRRTMQELDLDSAFDVSPRAFAFALDAVEPGRVWFLTRPSSVFVRPLRLGAPLLPPMQPTGREIVSPPQVSSVLFKKFTPPAAATARSSSGQRGLPLPPVRLSAFTYGYVADRLQGEDTGGLGGAFGILAACGRPFPFPEGRPWRSSWQQRVFNDGGSLGRAAAWAVDRTLQAVWPFGGAPVAQARNAP